MAARKVAVLPGFIIGGHNLHLRNADDTVLITDSRSKIKLILKQKSLS